MVKREAESPEIIKRRWDFKKEQIEILANNIQKLRYNVTLGLKDSDNEKVFLTALVVAIILETSERVGNEASASNGHVGVCGLKKKQISIDGNKITLEYTGKSGVEHIKSFSDEKIAKALKLAIKRSKTDDVFCTSDGFKIKADRINRFLSDFSVRAKDLRGMNCNKLMTDRLKNEEVSEDEKKRKKFFMQSLRKVAIKIGHGSGTLRKHYLIPELETNYIKNGNIIDISERDSYEDGGEIKKTINDVVKLSKTPAPKKDKIYGSKINKPESAESKYNASSIILSPNVIKSIVNIIHKHNEEYPEKKINISTAKAVVRRGMGAYSSTHRPTISDGKPNSRVAWGLARLNAFVYKIQNGKSKSGKYNQDDDLIDELGYKVKSYSKGGAVSDIEFKCNYEKYFEYVPLSEIEKYIEFDREIEHKISKKYLDELTKEIKVNGITYPITLEIYDGKGLIVEGNHRIAVAKRLGIKYIPVRVFERSRPIKGTIYEDKFKELPSSSNVTYAKAMYGVQPLDWDNSSAVHGFTKIEPKFSLGGSINRKLTYLGEVGGDKIGQKSSLEKAKSLEKQGISNEEIRQETGWFLNPYDKKWRFEISDEDFDVIQNFSEIKNMFDNDKRLKFVKKNLYEVIKHDKLFEAYPEFKTVTFLFLNENADYFVSVYTSKKDNLIIKYNLYDERKRISKSGGVESFGLLRSEKSALRIFDIFNGFMESGTRKDSERFGDEIYKFRRNILAHELQHVVQVREEFGGGSSPIWWYEEILKRSHINGRPIENFTDSDLHIEAEYFYQNSSGEIESKDVDKRLDFSEEKRKEVIPLSLIRINTDYVTVDLEKNYFEKGGEIEKITFDNFYKGTKADFKEIMKAGIPKRKPDFVSDSGSKYWFTANSVIRQSNHWGELDTCKWTLDNKSGHKITQGICNINDFKK